MEQKEKAEDRFRSLVQNSSDTTLIIGADTLISYASPATQRCSGGRRQSVIGSRAIDLVHREDRSSRR